jgi:DNA-binding NarL/FixJ family response regulator
MKFFILTFYSSDGYRKLAIQSGADYFFDKADDFDKVFTTVANIIRKTKNGTIISRLTL